PALADRPELQSAVPGRRGAARITEVPLRRDAGARIVAPELDRGPGAHEPEHGLLLLQEAPARARPDRHHRLIGRMSVPAPIPEANGTHSPGGGCQGRL